MTDKTDIKSFTYSALEEYIISLGEPKYRAGQIFRSLSRGAADFSGMSDIPLQLRAKLDELCFISQPEIIAKRESLQDGTVKYLFGLRDGNRIESVLMSYHHGNSVCISTQAGCKMGCVFCASFDPERSRNLTAGEMLDQVIYAGAGSGKAVSNVVLMGTGEPLDNMENVLGFLSIISDSRGVGIGMRHISLSTCGIVPKIDELAGHKLQLTLSVSLHAPDDALRDKIMPVNRTYPLAALMKSCRLYFDKTGRRISFEYAMIAGVNDSPRQAEQLSKLLKGMNCHVNLIPLNRVEGSPLSPTNARGVKVFQDILTKNHINATVRRSLGSDIDASCGQLRRRYS